MSQIRFNRQYQGFVSRDVESADVCGPEGPNALPLMMEGEFTSEATPEIICLANISRVPISIGRHLAEDVDARSLKVRDADLIKLESVNLPKAAPINNRRH